MSEKSKLGFAGFMAGRILTSIWELAAFLAVMAALFSVAAFPLSVLGYWALELPFGAGFVSESMVSTYYVNGFVGMVMVTPIGILFALKEEYDKVKREYEWRVENGLENKKHGNTE